MPGLNCRRLSRASLFASFAFLKFSSSADEIGFSAGALDFNYAEVLTAPSKSTQSGVIPDFGLYAVQRGDNHAWFFKERLDYADGSLAYNGSTQPPNPQPLSEEDTHAFLVAEALVGFKLMTLFSGSTDLSLYAGVNGRVWFRNLANPAEVYRLLTVPVGLKFEPSHRAPLAIGLDLSVRPLVYGRVKVNFTPASGYDSTTVPVTSALGFRAELPLQLLGDEKWGFILTPWAEYLRIGQGAEIPLTHNGQSIAGTGGGTLVLYEPSSHTFECGALLSLEFSI